MQRLKTSFKKLTRSLTLSKQSDDEKTSLIDRNAKHLQYLESVPNVLAYKGYELPGDMIHPKVLDDLQDLELRETDVLIVSYPQSGAAVAEDIVLQAITKLKEKNPSRGRSKCQIARLEVANPYGHMRWLNGLKSPRLLTSNLALDLLPEGVSKGVCKIIYIIRNPKDQSISYYYQHRVKAILSSLDDFFELYLNGHLLYGDYFSHVIDFWQLYKSFPQNVLFVSFEELKLESQAMTKLIVDFLGIDLTDEEVEQLPTNFPHISITDEQNNKKSEQRQYEGVIGDWLNYYKPEQSRRIDDLMRNKFETLGLSLCCESDEAEKRLAKFGRIIIDSKVNKKPIKSDPKKKKEKLKLAKDEYILLRHKSQTEVDIITERESTSERTCSSSLLRMCCPCLLSNIDYNRV